VPEFVGLNRNAVAHSAVQGNLAAEFAMIGVALMSTCVAY